MEYLLKNGKNVVIREMSYDDIPFICKADHDESEKNIAYLKNQLNNQDNQECSALIALYQGKVAGYVFLYVTVQNHSQNAAAQLPFCSWLALAK